MFSTWQTSGFWLVHSAFAGGVLLLVARALMACTAQPALRQRVGECGLATALAAAGLCLLPAWLVLPLGWDLADAAAPAGATAAAVPPAKPVAAPAPEERPRAVAEAPAFWPVALPAPEQAVAPVTAPRTTETSAAGAWLPGGTGAVIMVACLFVYFGGLVWFLARLTLGLVYLSRLVRTSTPAPAGVARLFEEMAYGGPLPRLLMSRRLRTPLSFGLFRPTVALPANLCAQADGARLRWVLRHELTHLRRRDAWSGLLCAVTRAVYFFVPWTWSVCRQVRLCQEYLADAAAVDGEDRRADYAEFLLTLTKSVAPPLVATGVSGNCSDLFRRVTMLLEKSVPVQGRAARRSLLPAAGLLLALAVLTSGVGLRALAAEPPAPAGGSAQPQQKPAVNLLPANPQPGFGQAGQLQIGAGIQAPGGGGVGGVGGVGPLGQAGFGGLQIQPFPMPGAGGFPNPFPMPGAGGFGGGFPANPLALPGFEELKKAAEKMQNAKTPDEIKAAQQDVMKAMQKLQANPGMFAPGGIGGFGGIAVPLGGGLGGNLFANAQARLGVQLAMPAKIVIEQLNLPQGQGLVVSHVLPNSAAEKAGLKAHDILLKFDGKSVPSNLQGFHQMVELAKTETPLSVVVLRKGKEETIQGVSLPKQVPQQPNAFGGFGPGGFAPVPINPGGFGGGFGGIGGGGFGGIGLPGGGNVMLKRNQDGFDCQYQNGALSINVTGSIDQNNKAQVGNIQIQDGGQINNYKSLQDVPAQHRALATQLVNYVNTNKVTVPFNGN